MSPVFHVTESKMDNEDELDECIAAAVVVAVVARKKRRRPRLCWVRRWLLNRPWDICYFNEHGQFKWSERISEFLPDGSGGLWPAAEHDTTCRSTIRYAVPEGHTSRRTPCGDITFSGRFEKFMNINERQQATNNMLRAICCAGVNAACKPHNAVLAGQQVTTLMGQQVVGYTHVVVSIMSTLLNATVRVPFWIFI